MRIPLIDSRGVPLMPCTPPKARILLKEGKAKPKRNKLGLFYMQLTYEQEPDNQPLVAGVDPGSKFEGYSVVGTQDTVLNLMVEAPDHVKDAVETPQAVQQSSQSQAAHSSINTESLGSQSTRGQTPAHHPAPH